MIELLLTCFPILLRIGYLKHKGLPVTFYSIHRAFFVWLLLFFSLVFAVEYYHPDTRAGIVPFRIVPVVAEEGGTVTSVMVEPNQKVNAGDLLFTVDDQNQRAAVAVAEASFAEIKAQIDVAKSQVAEAEALLKESEFALAEAGIQVRVQQALEDQNSVAFAPDKLERAKDQRDAKTAAVDAASAALKTVRLQLEKTLPAKLTTAEASLRETQIKLEKTNVRAQVSGRVEQLTLFEGARAAQIALNPAMLIVPDTPDDLPLEIVAGFSQVMSSVLHVGMPAEIACDPNISSSMKNAILPARISRIQRSFASGQLAPTGKLLQPSDNRKRGDLVVHFKLMYPEHQKLLVEGSSCLVQAYTTRIRGSLQDSFLGGVIQAWAIEKALIMRMKVWVSLVVGAGVLSDSK